MDNLRSKIIKLAHSKPELRPYLLPILKQATDFPTQEALDKYLKDHPGADKSKHKVTDSDKGKELSDKAEQSSAEANRTRDWRQSSEAHAQAMHDQSVAAKHHEGQGNTEKAKYHREKVKKHKSRTDAKTYKSVVGEGWE